MSAHSKRQIIERYKTKIIEVSKALEKIKTVSSVLNYKGLERINRTTLFEVNAKHTNQFTIYLGMDYYVQVRAAEAVKLLTHRLAGYTAMAKQLEEEYASAPIKEGNGSGKLGKEKVVKFQEGSGKGYMELIGQQNGEDIFNIVQIEGEEVPFQIQKNEIISDVNDHQFVALQTAKQQIKQKQGQAAAVSQIVVAEQVVQKKEEDDNGSEQYDDVDDLNFDSEDDDDGQTDLIRMLNNKKIHKCQESEKQTSTLQTAKVNKDGLVHPALPVQQIKQTSINKQVENVIIMSQSASKLQKPMKLKSKQVPVKKSKQQPPAKLSKFKLQKMKQKLQKQLE